MGDIQSASATVENRRGVVAPICALPCGHICTTGRILYNAPSKLPLPIGGSGRQSNTWFPGPTLVLDPNGISIGSAVFAGLISVTYRPTDHARYSVDNNRPHLRT